MTIDSPTLLMLEAAYIAAAKKMAFGFVEASGNPHERFLHAFKAAQAELTKVVPLMDSVFRANRQLGEENIRLQGALTAYREMLSLKEKP